jgi:juvenile hormone diol kinase
MINATQQKTLPRLFKMYDADRNGYIEMRDFERLLDSVTSVRNWKPGSEGYDSLKKRLTARYEHMQQFADTNRDGRISQAEWLAYIDSVINDPKAYEAELGGVAGFVFGLFDRDNDGKLTLDEYKQWFRAHGLNEQDASRMFDRLNLSHDGHISKDQFSKLIDEFFMGQNPDAPGNYVFGS